MMDFNEILSAWREGRLSCFEIDHLKAMSTRCVAFIQNRIPDATHAKSAIDPGDPSQRNRAEGAAFNVIGQTED